MWNVCVCLCVRAFLSPSKWNTRIKKINSFLWLPETMVCSYQAAKHGRTNITHHLIHLYYKLFSSVFHLRTHLLFNQRWTMLKSSFPILPSHRAMISSCRGKKCKDIWTLSSGTALFDNKNHIFLWRFHVTLRVKSRFMKQNHFFFAVFFFIFILKIAVLRVFPLLSKST